MSKSEHRHRGIKERHLREGYRNIFKPELFSSSSLARHVVAFSKLRGSAMTRMQAKAMHRFHHEKIYDLSQKIHTVRGGASGSASDIDVFQAYCDLFDDLFFFGSLKGNCKFHLGEEGDAEKSGETASRDETKKRSLKRRGRIFYVEVQKRCDIYLYAPSVRSSSRAERLLVVLGSLLHGMAHAFLILWACHHKGCIGDNSEHKYLYNHSKYWQDIAHALETAVRDQHIGLAITLNRVEALAQELLRTGSETPNEEAVRKWDIERAGLERELAVQEHEHRGGLSRRACL